MDVVATPDQKAYDRNSVRDVKEDDASRNHAVEGRIAPQVQQSQDRHDDAADEMCPERDIDAGVDVAEEFGKGEPAVASKGPAEPALPGMASDQTPDARRDDQGLQHNGPGRASEGLIEQGQDGYECGRGLEIRKAVHAEEEADGEEPRGDKSDGDGPQDGDGDHFLRAMDFLGQMSRAVEAGKGIVGVDESDNEGDPVGGPSRVVHKVGKDKSGILMRWRLCRNRDQDDEERNQGCE